MTKVGSLEPSAINTEVGKLKQTVSTLLERFLPDGALSEVRVDASQDSDGDRIYRITIVLQPGREQIDGKKTLGFVRHLRSNMEEDIFPIVSFVSKSDAEKVARAAV